MALVAGTDEDLFAEVEDRHVQLWSLARRAQLAELELPLSTADYGAPCLTLVSGDPPVLVTAAAGEPVSGFNALTGERLWSWPDLKERLGAGSVAIGTTGLVAHSPHAGRTVLLDARTGKWSEAWSGARRVFASPDGDLVVTASRVAMSFRHRHAKKAAWSKPCDGERLLDVAFSEDEVLIRYPGELQCFRHSGTALWRNDAAHFIARGPDAWHAIVEGLLVRFDDDGAVVDAHPVRGDPADRLGRYLLTSGAVLSMPAADVVWRYRTSPEADERVRLPFAGLREGEVLVSWAPSRHRKVESLEQLLEYLEEVAVRGPRLVRVIRPNRDTLIMGIGAERSFLSFTSGTNGCVFATSTGDEGASGRLVLRDQETEVSIPLKHCVSSDGARLQTRDFFMHGTRSSDVRWEKRLLRVEWFRETEVLGTGELITHWKPPIPSAGRSAPPASPQLPIERVARAVIDALLQRSLLVLGSDAERAGVAAALAEVLGDDLGVAVRGMEDIVKCLAEHDAVDDLFCDDETLRAIIGEAAEKEWGTRDA